MKKFEAGKNYVCSDGKEYKIVSRAAKTVIIVPANDDRLILHTRYTIRVTAEGNEFLQLVKGVDGRSIPVKGSGGRILRNRPTQTVVEKVIYA